MQEHKPIIHLKVTVGKPTFDEKGASISEVQTVKIEYDSKRWVNYLKQMPYMGFGKVECIKVMDYAIKDGKEVVTPNDELVGVIAKEIKAAFEPKSEDLTPDQRRIAELEAKLNALLESKEDTKDADLDEELEALRIEYTELTGEVGKKNWKAETIRQKIAEFKVQ